MKQPSPQLRRVAGRTGRAVSLNFDGAPLEAVEGESVLAALLNHGGYVRRNEFSKEQRAGFCLMGACQDCWVWTTDGGYIRACTTPVSEGMTLFSEPQMAARHD